jgi:hypothetical protein
MQPFRSLLLAVPVVAGVAVSFAPAAEAHRRRDGGAALLSGLIGLGVGALAGGALSKHSDGYEPAYAQPRYAPPPSPYGYEMPAYVVRPPVEYAPPPVYYAPPPIAYYAPSPSYVVPPAYQDRPSYARWSDDD